MPRSIGGAPNNSVMLGLGALTSYSPSPARSFPKEYFYFIDWNTPPTSPCPPNARNTRRAPYSSPQRSLQRSRTVSDVPPSPHRRRINPQPKPLAPPTTTTATIFSAPCSPTALKEETLLQQPTSLLHHVPDFRARRKFGKQIGKFFSLQAELLSSTWGLGL